MHQHAWLLLQCKMPRLDVSQRLKGAVWTVVSDLMKKSVPTILTTGTDRSPWTRLDPQACFTWTEQCLKRLKRVISLNKQSRSLTSLSRPAALFSCLTHSPTIIGVLPLPQSHRSSSAFITRCSHSVQG